MKASLPAIVLAGGTTRPEVQARGWPPYRAMAPVAGRPMLRWVLEALEGSASVSSIAVVGPEDVRPALNGAALVPMGDTMWDNVAAGLRSVGEGYALLGSSDIPLLTPDAVDDLVKRGMALNADFVYPIIRKEHNLKQCPGLSRTYATVREGTFTGGNMMLVNAPRLLANDALIRQALAARKKPLELARLISPWLVVKVFTKRARVSELERQVGRILNARAAALPTPFAELGADLDDPDEAEVMEGLLTSRRG